MMSLTGWITNRDTGTTPLRAETLEWWRQQRARIQARTTTLNTTPKDAAA